MKFELDERDPFENFANGNITQKKVFGWLGGSDGAMWNMGQNEMFRFAPCST
jgi:hypothetical protein